MADSLTGDIGGAIGGALNNTVRVALGEDALKSINEQLPGIMGPLMQSFAESGTNITSELTPFIQHLLPDVIDAMPDSGAEATHVAAPAQDSSADIFDALSTRIDSLSQSAITKVSSDDSATAAQGQLELQQLQQLTESIMKMVQERADMEKQVIEGLRGDADIHDGTVVAVADMGDAHATVHVEADSSYDHPADHSAVTPAHEEAAPDPGTTA